MNLSDLPIGKGGFCLDGHGYYKYFKGPGRKIHYRCGQYQKTKCKVKLVTTFEGKVLEMKNEHNHPRVVLRRQRRETQDWESSQPAVKRSKLANGEQDDDANLTADDDWDGQGKENGASPLRLVDERSVQVGQLYPIQTTRYANASPHLPRPFLVKDEPFTYLDHCALDVDDNSSPELESPASASQRNSTLNEDPKVNSNDIPSTTKDPTEQQIKIAARKAAYEMFSGGNQSMKMVNSTISDEFEITAKKLAYQLRAMAPTQQIIAEKLIADVMFHGQMGQLKAKSSFSID